MPAGEPEGEKDPEELEAFPTIFLPDFFPPVASTLDTDPERRFVGVARLAVEEEEEDAFPFFPPSEAARGVLPVDAAPDPADPVLRGPRREEDALEVAEEPLGLGGGFGPEL